MGFTTNVYILWTAGDELGPGFTFPPATPQLLKSGEFTRTRINPALMYFFGKSCTGSKKYYTVIVRYGKKKKTKRGTKNYSVSVYF
jgi:hypothetical protein